VAYSKSFVNRFHPPLEGLIGGLGMRCKGTDYAEALALNAKTITKESMRANQA
jgi:hypothetical protein